MEEQNYRLTTGLSAVYHWDRERSSLLAVDQCTDAYVALQTLFMQGMSGNPQLTTGLTAGREALFDPGC